MADRVELPGGAWAEIKGADDATLGDRKALIRSFGANRAPGDPISADEGMAYSDTLILHAVSKWSFGNVTEKVLDSVPLSAFLELEKAVQPFHDAINASFSVEDAKDKSSPTGASEG